MTKISSVESQTGASQIGETSSIYRSRPYYESKILHNTELSLFKLFSTSHGSLKTDHFDSNSTTSFD